MQPSSDLGALSTRDITTLTFDCYGTLVDWEQGACKALRERLPADATEVSDKELVRAFLEADARFTAGGLMPYADVLAKAARAVFGRLGLTLDCRGEEAFVESVPAWPLFEETNPALERLAQHYRLAIISNIDDSLIAGTAKAFTVSSDLVLTSQRARVYKPETAIFAQALRELNEPPEAVLHVAEGLCEAAPARALGMGSVWVRRSANSDDGSGAVPNARVANLTELAAMLCPETSTS